MKKIGSWWRVWQRIGVEEGMSASDQRYIKTTNGLVVFVTFLLWLQFPFIIQLLPDTKFILINFLSWIFLIILIPTFNHYKHYTAARLTYSLFTLFTIFCTAIQLGPETANHLFMVAAIIAFFSIFPKSQMKYLVAMIALAFLGFIALEWFYDLNDGGILDLPPEFVITAKISSMSAFIFIMLAITAYHYNLVNHAETNLEIEHQRSEGLLLNILPKHIATRLKNNEGQIADQVEDACVLFSDIVGFTELSEKVHHTQLVFILDKLFTRFDQIVSRHQLEKIKMIGDAYMIGGGLNSNDQNHHVNMAACALDMVESIKNHDIIDAPQLGVRIGIHCGPVVAGVICENKFAYDLWGDTVNTASRMESHGLKNQIQVSSAFFEKTKDHFIYEERGPIHVKGKGEMTVYLLLGRK
jgi:class 3 adenylate cyclase